MTLYKLSGDTKKTVSVKAKAKKAKTAATRRAARKKTTTATKKTTKKVSTHDKLNDNKTKRSGRNRNNNEEVWSPAPSEDDTGEFTDDEQDNEDEMWKIYEQNRVESDASWNENYRRLQEFHSTYGHSGVPINWSMEPKFADWVSRQRQLFREIHSGYRIANSREEGRWKRLQVLKFPLDYEKWYRLTQTNH